MQSPKADRIIGSLTLKEPGRVGGTALLELVWVMSSQNRIDRAGIAAILGRLLTREEIVVEQAGAVRSAMHLYRKGNADFADCLIASSAKAAGCSRTETFTPKAPA